MFSYIRSINASGGCVSTDWWNGRDWTHHESRRVPFSNSEAITIAQRLIASQREGSARTEIMVVPA